MAKYAPAVGPGRRARVRGQGSRPGGGPRDGGRRAGQRGEEHDRGRRRPARRRSCLGLRRRGRGRPPRPARWSSATGSRRRAPKPGAGKRKPWLGEGTSTRALSAPVSRSSTTSWSWPVRSEARRAAADWASAWSGGRSARRTSGRRSAGVSLPVLGHELARVRVEDEVAGVGEAVAAPERLELVARQPPGAQDGVARVVGDDDPARRVPRRRVGLRAERQPADLHRAHRAVVVAPRPPEPHGVRRVAGAEHRAVRAVAPVVHPEHVLVGDHGVPAVAAPGRRPVGRAATARRSVRRPASRSSRRPEDDGRPDRDHALAVDWRAARSTARGAAAAGPPAAASPGPGPRPSRARGPPGASQSFVTSSPPSSTTNELCGRGDRQPVGGEHLEVRAEAVRPAAEDHVQVAVRVRRQPAGPVRAARAAAGWTR